LIPFVSAIKQLCQCLKEVPKQGDHPRAQRPAQWAALMRGGFATACPSARPFQQTRKRVGKKFQSEKQQKKTNGLSAHTRLSTLGFHSASALIFINFIIGSVSLDCQL